MTQQSNMFDKYDAVGNREDLVDAIYKTDTSATPFLSAIAKVKATNTTHEWQIAAIDTAGTNYAVEGDDSSNDSITATTRASNYCQISDKVVSISGTQMAMNPAGRKDEMSYQMAEHAVRLKKDVELALLDNNAKVAGNSSTARECAGAAAWITTNHDKNGATNPTGDGTDAWSGGTDVALTEGRLKSVLQQAYTNGGKPDRIIMNPFNRMVADGFSGNGTRIIDASSKTLNTSYSLYASPFGTLMLIPSLHCETNMVYVLDTSLWKFAVLRDFHQQDLAEEGDYKRKALRVEFTLEACNEKGNGIIVNASAS